MTQTKEIMVEITTYRDCSIQVNHNGYFITVLGGEAMNATSLHSLKEKIDDYLRAEAKQITVDLAVLDREGAPCRIIGINLGSGEVVTRPSGAQGLFVVNILDNLALVEEFNRVRQSQAKLRDKLEGRAIKDRFGYGRITSDEYPEKMSELQNIYDAAVTRSKENAQ